MRLYQKVLFLLLLENLIGLKKITLSRRFIKMNMEIFMLQQRL